MPFSLKLTLRCSSPDADSDEDDDGGQAVYILGRWEETGYEEVPKSSLQVLPRIAVRSVINFL